MSHNHDGGTVRESHSALKPRISKAEDPNTPVEVLRELASDPNPAVRQSVAENESAPEDVLRALSFDEPDVRFYVAGNQSAPEDVLAMLSVDEDEEVRLCAQATCRLLSGGQGGLSEAHGGLTIEEASEAEDDRRDDEALDADDLVAPWIRGLTTEQGSLVLEGRSLAEGIQGAGPLDLAEDPDTAVAILWYLGLTAEWYGIREATASNESAPGELLNLLARDPHESVRAAVEANPASPPEARRYLADVEAAASEGTPLSLLLDMAVSDDPLIRLQASANPAIAKDGSHALLQLLEREGLDGPLAWGLASNPHMHPLVLEVLAHSSAFDAISGDSVALLVAGHPNATPYILETLADCEYPDVQRVLASRI